ncbi:MAG: hypothetical protein JWN69_1293 [Alphaproteobacteria bacterium]|nr:hypothetical protein [Alphaproteobacteria bacterium]
MPTPKYSLLALLLATSLGACAQSGSFPSLAPRAAERAAFDGETPAAPAPPAAKDPALAARLDQLVGSAREGQRAFEAALAGARNAIARGGATQSESWIEAQLALSRLEAARTPTVTAQAELDALALERGKSGLTPSDADRAATDAAAEQIRALVATQDQELARLSARLAR